MKRGWKVGIVATAAALVVVAALQFAPKDDGLDWIRKYGGAETVMMARLSDSVELYNYTFKFDGIPDKLVKEIHAWNAANAPGQRRMLVISTVGPYGGRFGVSGPGITYVSMGSVNARNAPVFVSRTVQLSWLERQWRALNVKLGWSKPPDGRFEVVRVRR